MGGGWQRWTATARDWVSAVERAYVAAAFGAPAGTAAATADAAGAADAADAADAAVIAAVAAAAAGAVASRFLAVGTPRSIGLIGDPMACSLSLCAHRVWFQPADVRCAGGDDPAAVAAEIGGRAVSLDEALAADIVCIHARMSIEAARLRRGTHVNALAAVTMDDELRALAVVVDEPAGLAALAAGLRDGRQLDEIIVFVAGDLGTARAAISANSR